MIFIQFVDVRHLVAGNEFHQFVVHFRALRGMLFSWSINFLRVGKVSGCVVTVN